MYYLKIISLCLKRLRKTTKISAFSVLTLVLLKIQVLRGVILYNTLEDSSSTKISVMVDAVWGRIWTWGLLISNSECQPVDHDIRTQLLLGTVSVSLGRHEFLTGLCGEQNVFSIGVWMAPWGSRLAGAPVSRNRFPTVLVETSVDAASL